MKKYEKSQLFINLYFLIHILCFSACIYFVLAANPILTLIMILFLSFWGFLPQLVKEPENSGFTKKEAVTKHKKQIMELEKKNEDLKNILADTRKKYIALEESKRQNKLLPPKTSSIEPALDVSSALHKALNLSESIIKRKELSVSVSSDEELLLPNADPFYIHILFLNIIDNAIKYLPPKGSLLITASKVNSELLIVIKDSGIGLPAQELEQIFHLNYQGSNRMSGSGLGLAQAKEIVDFYHGTISARSIPGNGMGIYIELPLLCEK